MIFRPSPDRPGVDDLRPCAGYPAADFGGFFYWGNFMLVFFLEVLHGLFMAGMMWMITKLYDRIERLEARNIESADEGWEPVDLSDQREYELDQQEKRKLFFM
jgi:hypothetical protein